MVHRRPYAADTEPKRGGVDVASDEDARFLSTYDASKFEHPSLAVDVALVSASDGELRTLLLRRPEPPQRGRWSLPGTFVRIDEPLEATAERALATKCGVDGVFLEQLYTFGALGRDPRTRVVTVAYYALIESARLVATRPDCSVARIRVPWEGEIGGSVEVIDDDDQPLLLAFDHAEILGKVVQRLRGKLDYTPIGFELLGERFTLAELQRVHETILGHAVNKDSFRRRVVSSGRIEATGDYQEAAQHRPAELFRFRRSTANGEGVLTGNSLVSAAVSTEPSVSQSRNTCSIASLCLLGLSPSLQPIRRVCLLNTL